jgi:hypothetical protein
MNEVYEENGQWWYLIHGTNFGPYTSKELAEQALEHHLQLFSKHCPTCED